jgi:hypothetical protein
MNRTDPKYARRITILRDALRAQNGYDIFQIGEKVIRFDMMSFSREIHSTERTNPELMVAPGVDVHFCDSAGCAIGLVPFIQEFKDEGLRAYVNGYSIESSFDDHHGKDEFALIRYFFGMNSTEEDIFYPSARDHTFYDENNNNNLSRIKPSTVADLLDRVLAGEWDQDNPENWNTAPAHPPLPA